MWRLVGNAGFFHGVVDSAVESRAGHALDFGYKAQIGVYRHIVVERRLFGQIADALAHLHRFFDDVETSDFGFALRRRQITGKYAHRRGLARAIRPEETEDDALVNIEGHILHGDDISVVFGQFAYFNHRNFLLSVAASAREKSE